MRRTSILVLSDNRSGSTLLDQCLGAHPNVVSLGEVHWLRAYVHQDRSIYNPAHPLVCSCGETVNDCPFWSAVAAELGRPLDSLRLELRMSPQARSGDGGIPSKVQEWPRRAISRLPDVFRYSPIQGAFSASAVARDTLDLFDAVCRVTGKGYCVDSSKSAFRYRALYEADPARTLAVILVRDYRAVVHSKIKHGNNLEAAALGWRSKMKQIEALTRDVPETRKFQLRYESLCRNPEMELKRLCDFIGVDFSTAMLQRPTDNVHHIGGSPSKFDPQRTRIAIDTSAKGAFQAAELEEMRRLVGPMAVRWGY